MERQTERFYNELRRHNYTTPTSYLELIRYGLWPAMPGRHPPTHPSIHPSLYTSILNCCWGVSPLDLLALVCHPPHGIQRLYLDILGKQREVVSHNESRYRGGLQTLAETEKIVADLQDRLTEMAPVLVKAAQETEDLLEVVAADQDEASIQQEIVSKDVAEANKVAAEVQVRRRRTRRRSSSLPPEGSEMSWYGGHWEDYSWLSLSSPWARCG